MNTSQLYVFHDGRDQGVFTVGNSISFSLNGVLKKFVDKNGAVRGYVHCGRHIVSEHTLVVNHFHGTAPQNVRRPYHQGIAYPLGHLECLF